MLALISSLSVIVLTALIIWPAGTATIPTHPVRVVSHVTPITTPLSANSAITRENQKQGTLDWQLDPAAHIQTIQGYAGQVSALPGQHVSLYVSSVTPVIYELFVYRLGWYGGMGAHLYDRHIGLHSLAQGYWMQKTGLVGCATCHSDPITHLLEPHWQKSYDLTIGADWPSGVYLIKLVAADEGESYIPLVIRAATSHAAALVNLPVNTYQAYNLWGGYSAYAHVDKVQLPGPPAVKVTFDRPYDRCAGATDLLSWDILSIRWLERSGLDATYTTNVDLDAHPETLLQHRAFIDLGHDEYWSRAQRDGVVAARDRGVSLAFLGANDDYWQMRFEPNSEDQARRTFVCYKVLTSVNLKNDPVYATHPDLTTTLWADPALHQPAEEVIGLRYQGYFANGHTYLPTWHVSAPSSDPLLAGTGLTTNSGVAHGLLGYEVDGVGSSHSDVPFDPPADLVILATSPVTTFEHVKITANSAYYRAASGAFVFDAGSIWWCWGLDALSAPGAGYPNMLKGSPAIERLTANIVIAMLAATPVAPITA